MKIQLNILFFKKESPSPVEVEPGDLFLLKYGKRKKKQSTTGKEGGIAQLSCLFLNPVARFQRVLCTHVTKSIYTFYPEFPITLGPCSWSL